MNIVFYDGNCGFCDHTVQLLLKIDKKELFMFAPLQGKTAKKLLKEQLKRLLKEDTLVVIENVGESNEKMSIRSKAVFRIFWVLGGVWSLIGWLSFLPAFFFDWGYRLVARNRGHFFSKECPLPPPRHTTKQFLP
jgi:predicted DCC family thiol-disulfide oxidoreductase YuxK